MKPFNDLVKFVICMLGILGVCMAYPESIGAKVKIVTVSTQTTTVHGDTERPERKFYQKIILDGYLWITADTAGNTLVYNSDTGFSNNSDDLIDLSSPAITSKNDGNETPSNFAWNYYEITIVGTNESKDLHVKMDGGAIGRLILGDKSNTISTSAIDLEITGGTIDQFIFAGKVSGDCNVTMKDCRLAGAYGPVRDTDFSLTMDMSRLNMTIDKSVTYTHPRFIFEDLMPLVTDGAKIDLPYKPNSDNVYEINDSVDFYWFEAYVDEKINDINGKLMNDIKVSKHTMVGSHKSPFKGVFDGNGHTISDLKLGSYIGKIDNSTQYAGLFGFVQGTTDKHAVIKNLTVEGNIDIYPSPMNSITYLRVGGVVGIADQYVEVMDVVSNVSIVVDPRSVTVKTHLGGVVGSTDYSESANGPLYVDRCTYKGYITQGGYNACGGIVGYINKGHIYDCINAGTITNNNNQQNTLTPSWVSGILGYTDNSTSNGANGFTLKRCINVGTVSANNDACKPACYAIGYANSCTAAAFAQLYYKEGTATAATGGSASFGTSVQSVTADKLKSGEFTYALNGGNTTNPAWRLTINVDDVPVLDKTHKVVYYGYDNCSAKTKSYINVDHPDQGHGYVDGFCKYCKAVDPGYLTAKSGYYELSTAKQLIWFAAYVNAGNSSANAKLMADITLSDSWTPIGRNIAYTGTFDGQGHVVYSVSISSSSDYVGFVGRNKGTIQKLIIGSGSVSGNLYCGGICGMNEGTISNCANYAAIYKKSLLSSTKSYFGGICGLNTGNSAKVENCYNVGNIQVSTSSTRVNVSYLGIADNNAKFNNCCYRSQSGVNYNPYTTTGFSNADFSNGRVTYWLNLGSTTNPVWRQNIRTDANPVLDSSHNVVYAYYANCTVTTPSSYTNDANSHTKQGHKYADGFCTYCNAIQSGYSDYYAIGNLDKLNRFADYVNAGNGSVKARLTNNVAQVGNIMIGTHEHPFQGEFDGNGFKISGLNQDSDFRTYQDGYAYAGLFGLVQGASDENPAVIKKLTVEGTIKLSSSASDPTFFAAGGVVGIADQYLNISDVTSYVNIENTLAIKTHMGGIVGTTEYGGTYEPLCVDRCIYHGTIKQSGNNACGGIVGFIKNGHIFDCVNAGTIMNVGNISGSRVCGILGYVNNSSKTNFQMKRCLHVGNLSGNNRLAITYANNCPAEVFDKLYYKSEEDATVTGGNADFGNSVMRATDAQLKSGEVAYALNGGKTTTPTWYQTIGTDDYPVFDSSHKVVYNTYADCESTVQYSNVNNGRTHQGHLWDEGTITTLPKCTETGVKTFVCQFQCGTSKTEPVAALGHTEETLAAVAPTCTETGLTEGKKCSVCDSTLIAQTEVAAKGHTEKDLAAVEPTCTENGFSAGKKCSVCNKILEEQTIIPPTGHTLGSVKSDANDHWFVCKTCKSMYGEEDHNHNAEDHSCSVCGVDKAEQDESGYYLVGNRKQLYWLNDYINYNHSANVRLTDDIVVNVGLLNAAGGLNESDTDLLVWNPISEYKGTFDGQGHSISGLYYKNEYNDNVGLFDIAYSSAVIRNLVIRDSYFEGITVGAICGEAWHSTIENCASHNTIKGQIIGGLVGRGVPQMKNSISTCQLVASDSIVVEDLEPAVGLLVGAIQPEGGMSWNYNANMDAKIKNCFYATSSDLNPFGKSVPYTGDGSENSVLDTLRVAKKALSAFQSGEVAYLLNETYDEESKAWVCNETTPVWRQNLLGHYADAFPVLDPSHKRVVKTNAYSYTIMNNKQFGTFCYGVDAALPDGLTAYYAVYGANGQIFGTQIEDDVIPSGTPVILRKPSVSNDVTISVADGYGNAMRQLNDTCVSGQLVGLLSVGNGYLPMGEDPNFTYTMQTIDGIQKFYWINKTTFKATRYRCYLDTGIDFNAESSMYRAVCLFENEETGLQELSADEHKSAPAYNLQGQRVQRMDRSGIYVQGDKRKMIK